MGVLLAAEQFSLLLQHHHQLHIQTHVLLRFGGVVGVLHKLAGVLVVELQVHIILGPGGVQVFHFPEFAGAVHHGGLFAVGVIHQQVGNAALLGHAGVVGTEGGGNMHNTRAVLSGDVVAQNDAEGLILLGGSVRLLGSVHHCGLHPGDELLVGNALQGSALALFDDAAMQQFRLLVGLAFGKEVAKQSLCHDNAAGFAVVGVGGLHQHIVDGGAHTQCRVRRQCPRGGCPCNGVGGHFR